MPWAMQMRALSQEEPDRLVQTLTGAILGCGGWVLSRGASDSGAVNLLFEFERRLCVDIYSVLIAAGLDLSQNGHVRFTELCQCTRTEPAQLRPRSCQRRPGDSDHAHGDGRGHALRVRLAALPARRRAYLPA